MLFCIRGGEFDDVWVYEVCSRRFVFADSGYGTLGLNFFRSCICLEYTLHYNRDVLYVG